MAITAKDVEELHAYGKPDTIRIRLFAGSPANLIWVNISKAYVFTYNHEAEKIEIRDRTQTGSVLHSFDDTNTVADIEAAFRAL